MTVFSNNVCERWNTRFFPSNWLVAISSCFSGVHVNTLVRVSELKITELSTDRNLINFGARALGNSK